MIKGPKIIHPIRVIYAESNAVAIKANILWHKYEIGKKAEKRTFSH